MSKAEAESNERKMLKVSPLRLLLLYYAHPYTYIYTQIHLFIISIEWYHIIVVVMNVAGDRRYGISGQRFWAHITSPLSHLCRIIYYIKFSTLFFIACRLSMFNSTTVVLCTSTCAIVSALLGVLVRYIYLYMKVCCLKIIIIYIQIFRVSLWTHSLLT